MVTEALCQLRLDHSATVMWIRCLLLPYKWSICLVIKSPNRKQFIILQHAPCHLQYYRYH